MPKSARGRTPTPTPARTRAHASTRTPARARQHAHASTRTPARARSLARSHARAPRRLLLISPDKSNIRHFPRGITALQHVCINCLGICRRNGKAYKKGESYIRPDCLKRCTCDGNRFECMVLCPRKRCPPGNKAILKKQQVSITPKCFCSVRVKCVLHNRIRKGQIISKYRDLYHVYLEWTAKVNELFHNSL